MKIITFSSVTKGHGAFTRHGRIATSLAQHNHEVYWVGPGSFSPEKTIKLQMENGGKKPAGWFSMRKQIRLTYSKNREIFDTCDVFIAISDYWAISLLAHPAIRKKSVVLFQRGDSFLIALFNACHPRNPIDALRNASRLVMAFYAQNRAVKKSDITVVQARFLKENMIKRHRVAPEKVIVLSNECYPGRFDSVDERTIKQLTHQIKSPDRLLIGMIAPAYWYGKGFSFFFELFEDEQIRAMASVAVAGDGLDRKRIDEAVLRLKDRIPAVYLGHVKSVKTFYEEIDLLIVPTLMVDACPNVLFEALYAELPIIASDIDAHKEILVSPTLLFKKGNIRDAREKLKMLLLEKSIRKTSVETVKAVKSRLLFDWDNEINNIIERVGLTYGK